MKKRFLLFLSVILLLASLPMAGFADASTYQYTGNKVQGTNIAVDVEPRGWQHTSLFEVQQMTTGALYGAYCIKWGPLANAGTNYMVQTLAEYTINHEKIRGILRHSYPAISYQDFRIASGEATLTDADVIAATQLAIWTVEQNVQPFPIERNKPAIMRAAQYLTQLPGVAPATATKINLTRPTMKQINKTIQITFSYGPESPTTDVLNLNYKLYNLNGYAEISKVTVNNMTTVTVAKTYSDLRCVPNFSCSSIQVTGTQDLSDVIALVPVGDSQPMVTILTSLVNLDSKCTRLPCFQVARPWSACTGYYYGYWSGQKVLYNGKIYKCVVSHRVCYSGMNPERMTNYWVEVQ